MVVSGRSGVILPLSKLDEIEEFVFLEKSSYGSAWTQNMGDEVEVKVVLAKDYATEIEAKTAALATDKKALIATLEAQLAALKEDGAVPV